MSPGAAPVEIGTEDRQGTSRCLVHHDPVRLDVRRKHEAGHLPHELGDPGGLHESMQCHAGDRPKQRLQRTDSGHIQVPRVFDEFAVTSIGGGENVSPFVIDKPSDVQEAATGAEIFGRTRRRVEQPGIGADRPSDDVAGAEAKPTGVELAPVAWNQHCVGNRVDVPTVRRSTQPLSRGSAPEVVHDQHSNHGGRHGFHHGAVSARKVPGRHQHRVGLELLDHCNQLGRIGLSVPGTHHRESLGAESLEGGVGHRTHSHVG